MTQHALSPDDNDDARRDSPGDTALMQLQPMLAGWNARDPMNSRIFPGGIADPR